MSGRPVIYFTKQPANSKQKRRKPPDQPESKGRNKKQLTYVEVKCTSPQQQERQNTNKSKDSPAPWRLVALSLGVLCLGLLVAVGILGLNVFRGLTISSGQQGCPGNTTTTQETGQKINSSGTCQLSCNQDHGCQPCSVGWYQYGQKCYRIYCKLSSWEECQNYCVSLNSSLSTLKTKEELEFVIQLTRRQCLQNDPKYWIGLKYVNWKWIWPDKSEISSDMSQQFQFTHQKNDDKSCGTLQKRQLQPETCSAHGQCLCQNGM
ncbi:natural killer cells antigen CD94-like [Ornithorhynchus anatinus]|uniref:C-type lectin domain-containing protein n=1 Tax=Ornithorhynchus anatinus TaxID=9258 RepID=A0A6I8MXK7_ORNAN|nr:natural killer cells antigen CD94-like [Ornithorhynchus anatinus]